jgi:hypothetical protein
VGVEGEDRATDMLVKYAPPELKPARACVPEAVDWREVIVDRRSGRARASAPVNSSDAEVRIAAAKKEERMMGTVAEIRVEPVQKVKSKRGEKGTCNAAGGQ